MKKFLSLLLCLGLCGCATETAPSFNKISLGMTKQEVIDRVGSPYTISAKDNVEYLKYSSTTPFTPPIEVPYSPEYFVKLVNGKVESYGKVGDFDSAKNPTLDLNANVKAEGK